jgi:hypothetical protein
VQSVHIAVRLHLANRGESPMAFQPIIGWTFHEIDFN